MRRLAQVIVGKRLGKPLRRLTCLGLAWLLGVTAAFCQAQGTSVLPQWVHQQWTVEHGLPVNALGSVLQADDGYLWIGTYDGLVRFDGSRFTVLRTDQVPALGSNRIIGLEETKDGLWIRAEPGFLSRYRDGRFESIDAALGDHPSPAVFVRDSAGNLWVGGSDQIFETGPNGLQPLGFKLPEGVSLRYFTFDSAGTPWLGTTRGIASFANDTLTWVQQDGWVEGILPEADRLLFFRRDNVPLVYRDGVWWDLTEAFAPGITLQGSSVVLPRPWGGYFLLNAGRLLALQDGVTEVLSTNLKAPAVNLLAAVGPAGERWLAMGNQVNRDGETVFTLPVEAEIRSLAVDLEGTVWLTTQNAGLHALRPAAVATFGRPEGLPVENVYSVYEDRKRHLWIGTHGGGLWRLAGGSLTEVPRRRAAGQTSRPYPRALIEDAKGTMWVGLLGGLFRVENGELLPATEAGQPVITDWVNALLIDREQRLWVGTTAGLYRRDPDSERTGTEAGEPTWQMIDSSRLPNSNIRTLAEDRTGGLWVGTAGGLARIKGTQTHVIDHRSGLPSDLIRSLHVDDRGILWVGTENGGLARIDPSRLPSPSAYEIVIYNRSNGLFSNGIHHILEDHLGFFWMSSNQGIFRVACSELEAVANGNAEHVESVAFTEREGMRNREANGGSRNAGLRTQDGRLWFATQAGVAVIDPELSHRQTAEPPAARIEHLRVGNDENPVPESGIRLAASERTFSIRYTVTSLRAAEQTRFRYRLEGYDDTWVDAGSRREAFFTRVPPGRYTFVVEARIAGQGGYGEPASTMVTIAPRLHETGWFRAFGICGFLLFGFGVLRLQAHRQRVQRLRLEAQVAERTAVIAGQAEKLRELDRLKTNLFTNVSHEFRTPLTLTIGPLQDLLDGSRGPLPSGARNDVELALRSSHRVLDLINQILDVARLEAGGVRLRVEEIDLVPWLEGRLAAFRPLAGRNHVSMALDPLPDRSMVFADPEQLAKVIDNLLSNAINLTPDGGRVRMGLNARSPDAVQIVVEDTGPGIPAEAMSSIFDRFRQVENGRKVGADGSGHRRWSGTGIGLALAKEIVELHHGTLKVESIEGNGATFTIDLRRGKNHFAADQLIDDSSSAIERPASFSHDLSDRPRTSDDESLVVGLQDKAPTQPLAGDPTSDPDSDGSEDRATILVVDDEPEVRDYVQRRLRDNFRVIEAEDGVAALRIARSQVPDLVVSDVMMPNLDGYGLARALKADPELAFVPILLLTAKASTQSKLTGLDEGVDDYLTKPFDGRELVARVRNLIHVRRRLLERFDSTDALTLRLPPSHLQPADQAFLERVRDLIAERMGDPDFGVEALAAALGCDRTYLFRKLRDLLDQTPSDLLRELRLARAAEMLVARVGTVAEIAYAVGFKSVSHFSQRFRKRYDATPTAYAARHAPPVAD